MDGGITFCPPIRKTTEGYTVPRTKKRIYLEKDPSMYRCLHGCNGGEIPVSCHLKIFGDITLWCGHRFETDLELSISQLKSIT